MNFAKVFQIDSLHQVLMEVVLIPGYPMGTCLEFTAAINGDVISIAEYYGDEDGLNQVFDSADQEFGEAMFIELQLRYNRLRSQYGE